VEGGRERGREETREGGREGGRACPYRSSRSQSSCVRDSSMFNFPHQALIVSQFTYAGGREGEGGREGGRGE